MAKLSAFVIADEIRIILEAEQQEDGRWLTEDGEILTDEERQQRIKQLDMDKESKVVNVIEYGRSVEVDLETVKARIAELESLKKRLEGDKNFVNNTLLPALVGTDESYKTKAGYTVCHKHTDVLKWYNVADPSRGIPQEMADKIPQEYIRTKTVYTPKVDDIKKAIKEGKLKAEDFKDLFVPSVNTSTFVRKPQGKKKEVV